MKKLVLDLEFNAIPRNVVVPGFRKHEIVQIGAVKLNEDDRIIDSINLLVKPQLGNISSQIEKLTHISNEDVADKPGFEKSIETFLDWIGEEDVVIYSWALDDYYQISGEAKLKDYQNARLERLYNNWMDLQALFAQKLGITKKLRLSDVISGCEFIFEGTQHSALDDAINTSKILQLMNNEDGFKRTFKPFLDMLNPQEEKYYPFAKFTALFDSFSATTAVA